MKAFGISQHGNKLIVQAGFDVDDRGEVAQFESVLRMLTCFASAKLKTEVDVQIAAAQARLMAFPREERRDAEPCTTQATETEKKR